MLRFEIISSSQLDEIIDDPRIMIIDVRNNVAFSGEHIRGAVNIPYSMLGKKINDIPQNKILVFYCAHGGTGILAAKDFFDRGYVVKALVGGIEEYSGNNKVFDRGR